MIIKRVSEIEYDDSRFMQVLKKDNYINDYYLIAVEGIGVKVFFSTSLFEPEVFTHHECYYIASVTRLLSIRPKANAQLYLFELPSSFLAFNVFVNRVCVFCEIDVIFIDPNTSQVINQINLPDLINELEFTTDNIVIHTDIGILTVNDRFEVDLLIS